MLGAVSLASMLVDRRGHAAHGCARAWSWLILVTTGVRVHASGVGRVEPGRSYVFVSNHQSIYDFPILITSIPFQLRILAKASLGAFPVLGWHLRYTGHLLVDRARAGRATLNRVGAMIRRGHSLIVFPEGTRSRDGRVGPFKRGLFLLAIDAGIPVVPVALTRHAARHAKGAVDDLPERPSASSCTSRCGRRGWRAPTRRAWPSAPATSSRRPWPNAKVARRTAWRRRTRPRRQDCGPHPGAG